MTMTWNLCKEHTQRAIRETCELCTFWALVSKNWWHFWQLIPVLTFIVTLQLRVTLDSSGQHSQFLRCLKCDFYPKIEETWWVLTCKDDQLKQKVLARNDNFSKNIPFGILTWWENAKLWEYEMLRLVVAGFLNGLFVGKLLLMHFPSLSSCLASPHPLVSAGRMLLNIAKKNCCYTKNSNFYSIVKICT